VEPNRLALYQPDTLDPLDDPLARPVVIVEGERAARCIVKAGHSAVATYGAGYTPRVTRRSTSGVTVTSVLWPDNDDPGRAHMNALARRIVSIAKSVHIVPVPPSARPELRKDPARLSRSPLVALSVVRGPAAKDRTCVAWWHCSQPEIARVWWRGGRLGAGVDEAAG
jgi:hypothetical protein